MPATVMSAFLALWLLSGLPSWPVLAGVPECPEAGVVVGQAKISELAGGLPGFLDSDDQFGISVASLGDLDGDGVTDLAVGANRDDDGGSDRGAVYILFMNSNGTVRTHQKISATNGLLGALDNDDRLGESVASLGDLDGDGVPDLAVGAYLDDDGGANRGAIYVLFLNADGTVRAWRKISSTTGGFTGPLDNNDQFGATVTSLGDLDGDGVTDLAVGAYLDDDGGSDRGAVYVLFMNTNGTVRAQQKISNNAGGVIGPLDDNDLFGVSVASLGDLDADGVTDLAVGAVGDDDGGGGYGAVYILFMNTNGTVRAQQKISSTTGGFSGTNDNDNFGISAASIGDIDGNGVGDLAVGANLDDDGGSSDRGAVYILFLNSNGTVRAEQKISSSSGGFTGPLHSFDYFGFGIVSFGDLNGNGLTDLAVGAYGDNDGGFEQGAVWILEIDGCETPPIIMQDVMPPALLLPIGGEANFTITATGDGALAYQWRRDGVPLIEGGSISGSTSSSVTILATQASAGFYDCVVSNQFGSVVSSAAILGVRLAPPCPGDADDNGAVNFADITKVLTNFNAVCP